MPRTTKLNVLVGTLLLLVVVGVILVATVGRTFVDDVLNGTRTRSFEGCEYVESKTPVDAVDGDAGTVAAGRLVVRCEVRPEHFRLRLAIELRDKDGHWRTAPDGAAERVGALARQTVDLGRSDAPGAQDEHYLVVTHCDPRSTARLAYTLQVTRDGRTHSTGPHRTAPVSLREHC
ncbi:hypothetical protein ACFWZ2_07405 [Streptomyces sp. NPDC059002]|uniref:hypothetical protein n=1 Tax=Streptomyces sp. NPDC059002 TaxID=3346690 RepID=UPI0036838231